MDQRKDPPEHSSTDSLLRRELLRPADARVPFVLALVTALLAGVLAGYLLRAAVAPEAERVYIEHGRCHPRHGLHPEMPAHGDPPAL
jgi:hypothetical protein